MRVYHTVPLPERFWPKVEKTETCWLWRGAFYTNGYGHISSGGHRGRHLSAHVVAWTLASGQPVPDGMQVLHNCPDGDNRACVRNDEAGWYEINGVIRPRFGHLWLGTNDENMADMVNKGRSARGDRHGLHIRPELAAHGDNHWTRRLPDRRARGAGHGRSKLTEEQAREILALRAAGWTLRAIADRFSVSEATVSLLSNGKTWSHLD